MTLRSVEEISRRAAWLLSISDTDTELMMFLVGFVLLANHLLMVWFSEAVMLQLSDNSGLNSLSRVM